MGMFREPLKWKERPFFLWGISLGLFFLLCDTVIDLQASEGHWDVFWHILCHAMIIGVFILLGVGLFCRRLRSEKARQESDERFRLLFAHSPHGIFLVETSEEDNNWRIIDCNPAASAMNGYRREELVGENVDVLHPESARLGDRSDFLKRLRREKTLVYETIYQRKDGTKFPVEVWSCLLNLDGKEVLLGFGADITERKRFEAALTESQEKYKALYQHSSDGILLIDVDDNDNWTIVDCNEAACRMNGYSHEEIVGMNIDQLNAEEHGVGDRRQVINDIRNGRNLVYEGKHRRKDGVVFPVESTGSLITIGGQEYLLGLDRDVSARKRAEAERRASEERYRIVVENVEEAIFVLDDTGIVLFLNRYGREILDASEVGFLLRDRLEERLANAAIIVIRRVLRRNQGLTKIIKLMLHGVERWFRVSIQPIREEGNAPGLVLCLAMDISEQKRHEQEIYAEKERLDVILRSIREGVIATDPNGHIVFLNAAAQRLTGWDREEAVGKMLSEVYRTPAGDQEKEKGCIGDISSETVLFDKMEKKHLVSENGAVIRGANGQIDGMVIAFRDVTEEKRMEEDILKSQKLESLGYLAGGIAHDFNNILAALLAKIQLTETLYLRGRDVRTHFREIEKAVSRAGALTHQLLTFSKGGKPIKKSLRMEGFLKETVEFALNGSRVVGEFAFEPGLWPAEVDEGQISQAINNLVINADQAMPEGGYIKIAAANITVGAGDALPLSPGKYVKISVQDHGIGIPKENLQKIFDPYFTTKQRGSGLGLTTTFSIIKRHDGYIHVDSMLGKGTTFDLYLPAAEPDATVIKAENDTLEGMGHIAVMDDNMDFLTVLYEALSYAGYIVEKFRDGRELLERYRETLKKGDPFDLVVLDLTVPAGMGGLETVASLRQLDPMVKAIVMSGYSDDPVLADYHTFGFCGAAVKPFEMKTMFSLIHEVLDRSRGEHTP